MKRGGNKNDADERTDGKQIKITNDTKSDRRKEMKRNVKWER